MSRILLITSAVLTLSLSAYGQAVTGTIFGNISRYADVLDASKFLHPESDPKTQDNIILQTGAVAPVDARLESGSATKSGR